MLKEHRYQEIVSPTRVWSRSEILQKSNCPIPKENGVYGWYFKKLPSKIPTTDCILYDGLTLLYVGISPKPPPKEGKKSSRQNLHQRIRYHMKGNAEGSTLRLTLGCLLADELGIQLRRVGSGKRMTFADGEVELSKWLGENAFVTWKVHSEPWRLEEELISQISLPLNLSKNQNHSFYSILSNIRKHAKLRAKVLPIVSG